MRTNLLASGRDYYDAITLLEELGCVCTEDKNGVQCLHDKKRMVFNITKEG